jgi:hypothetical protein
MIFALAALFALSMGAHGQHSLLLKGSPTPLSGTVLSSDGRVVQFQTQAGSIGYPLANVQSLTMPPPQEWTAAQQALAAGDKAKAAQLATAISAKFKGLPTDWARAALLMAAGAAIDSGDHGKAEAIAKEFEALYPGTGGLLAKVLQARIAVAKKDYLSAKDALIPVVEEALKAKSAPRENAFAYSQAFLAMGQVAEADGKLQDALENYLRTVTIFFHDTSARAAAQERADALRAKNKDKKTSEQLTAP